MRHGLAGILALCAVVAAAVPAACGSDDEPAAEPAGKTLTAPQPQTPEGVTVGAVRVEGYKDLTRKPAVIIDIKAAPPSTLVRDDLVRGRGARVRDGDSVSVQYVGLSWSTGKEFDSSWDRGAEPLTFTVGAGEVIEGWDRGVVGMRLGSRRLLVIPPPMAYGVGGRPPLIAPNETLVFVVDAVSRSGG